MAESSDFQKIMLKKDVRMVSAVSCIGYVAM